MRLLILLLAGLLLAAPDGRNAARCRCASRSLCIGGVAVGRDVGPALNLRVTLELRGGTGEQLSEALSRASGRRIGVLPSEPGEPVNLDIKRVRLWDVLENLSQSGRVSVEGRDFSELRAVRAALAGGKRVPVCINRAPLGHVVEGLAGLSGRPLRVTYGNEAALVSVSAGAITLDGILSRLSAQSRARIRAK